MKSRKIVLKAAPLVVGIALLLACENKPEAVPIQSSSPELPIPLSGSRQSAVVQEAMLPDVCQDATLLKAIRIIDRACPKTSDCNFDDLKELNRSVRKETLLSTLRNPYLKPVHLFFPANHSRIEDSFDWLTTKEAQLNSLAESDMSTSVVFVLGRASITGNKAHNERLSKDRMTSVYTHLEKILGDRCSGFRGAWFGNEILYLNESDGAFLGLALNDWRKDPLILNQAVHVFVFPCSRLVSG